MLVEPGNSDPVVASRVQSENQPFLDGIRGAAALYVLVAHCTIWGGGLDLPDPKIAVDVFMVLSGYLMMYLAYRRMEVETPGTAAFAVRFWIRRYFRIAPVYYLILAASFILLNQAVAGFRALQAQAPERWLDNPYNLNGLHGQEVQFSLANLFAVTLIGAYAVSFLLHVTVERPGINLGRKVLSRLKA